MAKFEVKPPEPSTGATTPSGNLTSLGLAAYTGLFAQILGMPAVRRVETGDVTEGFVVDVHDNMVNAT